MNSRNISRIHIGVLPEKITGIIEPTSERGQTEIFDFFFRGGSGKEEEGEEGGKKRRYFTLNQPEKWFLLRSSVVGALPHICFASASVALSCSYVGARKTQNICKGLLGRYRIYTLSHFLGTSIKCIVFFYFYVCLVVA